MKQLKTLIRMQKREMDELRQRMTQLETRRDGYIQQIEALNEELKQEYETAHQLSEMSGFFGDFSGAIKKRQQQIAASVVKVETQIQNLNIEIQKQFTELKKYEIVYERYLAELALEQKRAEQKEMDEIGIRNVVFGTQE